MLPEEVFYTLFRGNTSAYGLHTPSTKKDDTGKEKGKNVTIKEAPVYEDYAAHLRGEKSIGIAPLMRTNEVLFAALDIDVYPINPRRYVDFFLTYNIPVCCFRSKSGGLHAFIFFADPAPVDRVLPIMRALRRILGLPEKTEIFPKQKALLTGAIGNWINLPYYNVLGAAGKTERYLFSPEGEPMDFLSAMRQCISLRTTVPAMESVLSQLPFFNAPPCLQTLYLGGLVTKKAHNRNIFLFNTATYLKARYGEEFEERLKDVNGALKEPITVGELESTVIKSHRTGTYSYQCEEGTLSQYCDKKVCSKRKYGRASDSVSNLNFEVLTQVRANPPYYKWKINGKEVVFYSEIELYDQKKFISFCMRELHTCPNKLKQDKWAAVLDSAFKSIVVEAVSADESVSDEERFTNTLQEYLTSAPLTENMEEVTLRARAMYHTKTDTFVFCMSSFWQYLQERKVNLPKDAAWLHHQLKSLGLFTTKEVIGQKKVKFWHAPKHVVFGWNEKQEDAPDEAKTVASADDLLDYLNNLDDISTPDENF